MQANGLWFCNCSSSRDHWSSEPTHDQRIQSRAKVLHIFSVIFLYRSWGRWVFFVASQLSENYVIKLYPKRVIVLFPGYQPSPYWSLYWICTQHPACQWSQTSNQWNKCPKRGIMTTGGQIPIEQHFRSFLLQGRGATKNVQDLCLLLYLTLRLTFILLSS